MLYAASLRCVLHLPVQHPKLCAPPGVLPSCSAWSSRGPCVCCAKLLRQHKRRYRACSAAAPDGVYSSSSSSSSSSGKQNCTHENVRACAQEHALLHAVQHADSFHELSRLADECREGGWQAAAGGPTPPHAPRTHVFALFLRACKLLARAHKSQDLALLHQVRGLARPAKHRPALRLPAPSPVVVPGLAQQRHQARAGSAPDVSTLDSSEHDTDVWPLLHRLLDAAQHWLPTVLPHEAAYILYALGAAHKQRPHATPEGETACASASSLAGPIQAILHSTQPLLPRMKHSHLARMVWGLGALGDMPSQEWMQEAEARCTARSAAFGTTSCLLLLEGFAMLRHQPHPALLADLAQSLKPRLSWLRPGEQATLLHCLVALDFGPQPAWLHQFFQHSTSKIPGFTPAHFAQAASALARLRYVPPLWWVRRFMYYSHRSMGFFSATELAVTAHSLVRLNLVPPRAWLHDALAVLRALPAPVGAGQPRKQPQQQQQQQQQEQQEVWQHHDSQHERSLAQQQQQQEQQEVWQHHDSQQQHGLTQQPRHEGATPQSHHARSYQPQQSHQQRSPRPSLPTPSFSMPLHLLPDTQQQPLPSHAPLSSDTAGEASPRSNSNHMTPLPPHQTPPPTPTPTPPTTANQPSTLRQPPQRFPEASSHAQSPLSHPPHTPAISSTSSTSNSSHISSSPTSSADSTTAANPSGSSSGGGSSGSGSGGRSSESWRDKSAVRLRGYRVRVPAALRPPLWVRGAGRRAHRPPSHVSTLGDTARRRTATQQQLHSYTAPHQPPHTPMTHSTRSTHSHASPAHTAHGRPAHPLSHAPPPPSRPAQPPRTPFTPSTPSAHSHTPPAHTAHSRPTQPPSHTHPPPWRPPHPLSPEDTYRTTYVIAKLHTDPAVGRHAAWARAQLPRLLRTLGSRAAHAYFPAACVPASRSNSAPTHSPWAGLGAQPQSAALTASTGAHVKTHALSMGAHTQQQVMQQRAHSLSHHHQQQQQHAPPAHTQQHAHSQQQQQQQQQQHGLHQVHTQQHTNSKQQQQQQHGLHQAHTQQHTHSQQQQQQRNLRQAQHAQQAHAHHQQWQQQLLVDHLYICAELRYQPDRRQTAHLLGLMEPLLPSLTPSNCVAVTVCLAVLSLHPASPWVAAFMQRLQRVLPALPASDLAKALIAAAHLRLPVGPDFTQSALQHIQRLDLVQLAALVRALDGSKVADSVAWLGTLRTSAKRLFSGRV